jgi:hypothetical protein
MKVGLVVVILECGRGLEVVAKLCIVLKVRVEVYCCCLSVSITEICY